MGVKEDLIHGAGSVTLDREEQGTRARKHAFSRFLKKVHSHMTKDPVRPGEIMLQNDYSWYLKECIMKTSHIAFAH